MPEYNFLSEDANHYTSQDLMDAEAAGFAAASGKTDFRARESYIRHWGNTEIMQRYAKGFSDGFERNRTTHRIDRPEKSRASG